MEVVVWKFFRVQVDRAEGSNDDRKYDATYTDIQKNILQGGREIEIDKSAQECEREEADCDADLQEEKSPTKKWKSF